MRDYRFRPGDTVYLYNFQQQTDESYVWTSAERRTIQGATYLTHMVSASIAMALFMVF